MSNLGMLINTERRSVSREAMQRKTTYDMKVDLAHKYDENRGLLLQDQELVQAYQLELFPSRENPNIQSRASSNFNLSKPGNRKQSILNQSTELNRLGCMGSYTRPDTAQNLTARRNSSLGVST
jgi:hypothetical protein